MYAVVPFKSGNYPIENSGDNTLIIFSPYKDYGSYLLP